MRITLLASRVALVLGLVLALAGTTAALADDSTPAPVTKPHKVVYLGGLASLEALRNTNANHHARAERIIAAANELCRPGRLDVYYARFEATDISCFGHIFKTSNPPKREISLTLDGIRYIALVTVTDPPPQLVPAR